MLRALLFIPITLSLHMPAQAQVHGRESLLVRAYDTFGVPVERMRAASGITVATFAAAGIDVHWNECPTSRRRALTKTCNDVLLAREVVVRIVAAPRADRDPNVLGFSYIDAGARRGTLATVYMDRVMTLARRLRIDPTHVLGRAVAHEVAHLLLGTTAHASTGLMRDQWLAGRTHAADWVFSSDEAEQMRTALRPLPGPRLRLAVAVPPSESDSPRAR